MWRAEDLHLDRPVAIKQIVLSDHASTRSRTRAMREAQAAARLRHPGVVQLYDVHDDGGQIYLIMELVRAPSLSRVVRRHGALTIAATAQIGTSLLDTLAAVHAAGIVHRDIKPSNVLVGDSGVHVTDFGIALLGDDPLLTASGSVLGTPAYMAPEQARGERVGPAADLYGLGATLYFALEGRAPFADTGSVETTRAVRDQPHRPGQRLGALGPLIDGLLAKDPADRPDLDTIAATLDAAAEDLDIRPPPPQHTPGPDAAADDPTPDPAGDAPGSASDDHSPPADEPASSSSRATAPAVPGPPGGDDDRRFRRQVVIWTAALLVLLTLALLALFLAIRGNPEAPATVSAVLAAPSAARSAVRSTMWWSDS